MSVTSSKKIETNKYELEIAVNGNSFYSAMDTAFKKNSSKISIPGFRRGKAPRSIIEKMYGKEVFLDDAINEIYPRAYQEAIEELKLEPVDRPDVEILTADADGFTFKAIVTVKPDVEVKDYKGLKAEKTVREVSDKDVENEIKKLAERNARTVTVEDRAAKLDDITNIDFEGFVNDVAFEGGKGEGFSLTLGSGQFIPGFEDQIVGHNIGDEFDVNVTFPEVYHSEELAGKAAVFKVKLNGIQAKELPEIDDEFAKDVSEFDTIADLKADISKKLTEQNEKLSNEELENDLIASLVDNMTAEIPQVMFDNRVEDMVRDFEYKISMQGLNLDTYLKYAGMDMDAFKATFEIQAKQQVKVRLALEKVAEIEKLAPSNDEVEAEFKKIADSYGMDVEKVKKFIPTSDLAKDLAVNKAIDFIKDNADVTEKKEAAEKKPAKKPAAKKTTTKKAADSETAEKKPAAKKTTKKAAEKKDAE